MFSVVVVDEDGHPVENIDLGQEVLDTGEMGETQPKKLVLKNDGTTVVANSSLAVDHDAVVMSIDGENWVKTLEAPGRIFPDGEFSFYIKALYGIDDAEGTRDFGLSFTAESLG